MSTVASDARGTGVWANCTCYVCIRKSGKLVVICVVEILESGRGPLDKRPQGAYSIAFGHDILGNDSVRSSYIW